MLQTPRVCKPGIDARGLRQSAELTQESNNDDAAEYARHDQSCVAGLLWLLVAPVGRPTIVIPVATVNTSALHSWCSQGSTASPRTDSIQWLIVLTQVTLPKGKCQDCAPDTTAWWWHNTLV